MKIERDSLPLRESKASLCFLSLLLFQIKNKIKVKKKTRAFEYWPLMGLMDLDWAIYKWPLSISLSSPSVTGNRLDRANGKVTNWSSEPRAREKMVVEDFSASAIMATENIDPNTTTNPSLKEKHVLAIKAISGDEEGPSKEKTILSGGNDYASKKSTTVIQKSHFLENSWTFWFDNPSSKSNQVTWGSSLRSLYTFATIEEFWRWDLCWLYLNFLLSRCY